MFYECNERTADSMRISISSRTMPGTVQCSTGTSVRDKFLIPSLSLSLSHRRSNKEEQQEKQQNNRTTIGIDTGRLEDELNETTLNRLKGFIKFYGGGYVNK